MTDGLTERRADAGAVLVGATDRRPEELLQQAGIAVRHLPAQELSSLALSAATPPQLVVVDLRGQEHVPPAVALLRRQHPQVGVLIVATTMDTGMMLEAMRAGVNECVAEPLVPAEFDAAVARLVSQRRTASAIGQIFAFVGAKGGVGTTTMAVNVATALARDSKERTLFVDLHLSYGDAAVFFGAEPRFSVVDALENTHRLDETFFAGLVTETKAGPGLLASSDRSSSGGTEVRRVRTLLEFAAAHYRYTVLDVPRSDAATLESLEGVTKVLVVANQEVATIRSAARMATTLRQRYGKERVQVVITRYDQKSEIGQEDIQRVVGGEVRHMVPSDYRLALQALNKGRPLTVENGTKLAEAFRGMARDLGSLAAPKEVESKNIGLLGSLLGRR
jgi:pilus assembly protein CpaE